MCTSSVSGVAAPFESYFALLNLNQVVGAWGRCPTVLIGEDACASDIAALLLVELFPFLF